MKQLTDEQIEEMARQEQLLLVCDDLEALTEIVRATERALAALDTAQPVPEVNAMLVEALKDTMYSLQVPPVSCQQGVVSKCKCRKCVVACGDTALTAAQQAQPERAPLSDAEIEQEFCNITGLETGINPAAADTKRALVWFKKGYAHGIKQGGQ